MLYKYYKKMGKLRLTPEDKLWASQVKERDGWKCVICGCSVRLNAHHLLPREIHATKYDINNGLSLCPKHHFFSRQISAHNSPLSLALWLQQNRPDQWRYIITKIAELQLLQELYENA